MNVLKKSLSLLLALIMLTGYLMPVTVRAEETEFPEITTPEEPVSPEEITTPEMDVAEETIMAAEFSVENAAGTANPVMAADTKAISDYSDYTFQLRPASSGGAYGAFYINCYYLEYKWWSSLSLTDGLNERFHTRVRFEKDTSTGKYRLYYYGVHSNDQTLYANKYYLTAATVPSENRAESNGFYYGDLYGYECINITTSADSALLWEVTSSNYLKTKYKGSTYYLWTTTTPYGDTARYLLRLRTSTAEKGNYGMAVSLTHSWFDLSNYHAHTPGAKQVTKEEPATCISAQKTYQALICSNDCGAVLASNNYRTGSKDPSNHTAFSERLVNEQPATCQAPYTYEIELYCTGCKQVTETQGPFQEGEPLEHVPADPVRENVTSGSCMVQSSYDSVVYCSLCSAEISRSNVETGFAPHAEVTDQAVEATCTETGLTEGTHCSVCNAVLVPQTVIDALGHTEVTDAAVAATCTTSGLTEGKHCSVCHEVLLAQVTVNALGHHWDEGIISKEPTEEESGIRTYTCQTCGETKKETIPNLEHVHKYDTVTTAPTCEASGFTTYTCKCGDSYVSDSVAALGHTEVTDAAVPATCTTAGLTEGKHCSVCNEVFVAQTETPALGHKWDNGIVTKEPTEEESGIRKHTCTVCRETEERTIPVKEHEHKYTAVVTAPTCVKDGYTTYTCTCGDSYVSDTVPALGHTAVIDTAVAATCTTDGLTEGKHCSVCEVVLIAQTPVTATGHSWNDGVVTRQPTAVAPGIRTFTCTVCKTTRTEEIPYEAPVVTGSVQRISGKDRVKTALSVAKALKDTLNVDKFDAVIIATGVNEKFADALAGSYLANRKKAPILLYTNSGLSQLNVNFIQENLKANGTVYILGGDSAVPTTVEQTLAAYNVVRLSGKTRYETNLAILKEAGISGNEILVATGTNFADSLSASAVGLPLLLVNGKNTAPNAVQTEFLKSVAGKKITIIGGDGAVSEEMKAAIEKITGVTAERISGKTRHNTSVLIARKYFPDADFALITYAKNFPDGLAGGPLAYALGAPLLLTNAGQEGIAGEYIVAEDIENGYVLGGDSAVSDETARKVFGLAADAAIVKAYYTK